MVPGDCVSRGKKKTPSPRKIVLWLSRVGDMIASIDGSENVDVMDRAPMITELRTETFALDRVVYLDRTSYFDF